MRILGTAAEFERPLIVERSRAGRLRYLSDWEAGLVGKTVHNWSGKHHPPHRPKRLFDREQVMQLRREGLGIRAIAMQLRLGVGTVVRTLAARSRSTRPEKDARPADDAAVGSVGN